MDLTEATIEDIVEELRRRKLTHVLFVSAMLSGQYRPGGDIASEDRERAFAFSPFCDLPPGEAAALCLQAAQHFLREMPPTPTATLVSGQLLNIANLLDAEGKE